MFTTSIVIRRVLLTYVFTFLLIPLVYEQSVLYVTSSDLTAWFAC